jgi:hypothetical protein
MLHFAGSTSQMKRGHNDGDDGLVLNNENVYVVIRNKAMCVWFVNTENIVEATGTLFLQTTKQ